jgi:hypothetical protein
MSKKAEDSAAHWIEHNQELAGESPRRVERAVQVSENNLASDLAAAVRAMDSVNYPLLAALNKVAGPVEYPS